MCDLRHDETLRISPEPVDVDDGYERDWDVRLGALDTGGEAEKLVALLHGDRGRGEHDPLFVSFMES